MTWAEIIKDVPGTKGVYSVWAEDACIYIGTAHHLRVRLMSHGKRSLFLEHGVTHVRFVECDHRLSIERWLIAKHKPILNLRIGRGKWGHIAGAKGYGYSRATKMQIDVSASKVLSATIYALIG